jgi:hypothetical protein
MSIRSSWRASAVISASALLVLSVGLSRGDWDLSSGPCQQLYYGSYVSSYCGVYAQSPSMSVATWAYSLVGSAGSDAVAGASDISSFSSAEFGNPPAYGCDVLRTGCQTGAYYNTVVHGECVGGYFASDYN